MSATAELQRREPAVACISLHPGNVYTEVTRRYPPLLRLAYGALQPLLRCVQPSLSDGASTSVFAAATTEVDSLRGAYLERSSPIEPAVAAADAEVARKLWALSERLVAPWSLAL